MSDSQLAPNASETASTDQETSPSNQERSPKAKKRLNLDLTPEAYELLQKLADESGKNMADVLRTGLALYGLAHEESRQGRNLAIEEDGKVVTKIVAI